MSEAKVKPKAYEKITNETTRESIRMYIEEGYSMGHFLEAVFSNDLFEAVARGDHEHVAMLPELVEWIYNEAPSSCWGSKQKVQSYKDGIWGERIGR